ncbi:MAG: PTS sugar transporter subunit IIA, partial [Acidobacteriota bacterium]
MPPESSISPKPAIHVVLVSHGRLAEELVEAARKITGSPLEHFESVCLDWSEGKREALEQIEAALRRQADAGVHKALILADLFGDTPCKAAMSFVDRDRVELISGVNLPMVVKLGCLSSQTDDLPSLAEMATRKAQNAIRIGSRLLDREGSAAEAGDRPPSES